MALLKILSKMRRLIDFNRTGLARYVSHESGCFRTEDNTIVSSISVNVPEHVDDLYSFMRSRMEAHGDKTAIVDGISGESNKYNEILEKSSRLATFFKSQKINKQAVGMHVPNCIEYIYPVMACLENRTILTTANPAYTHFEISKQMNDADTKLLFTNKNLLDIARKAANQCNVDKLICIDDYSVNDSGVINLSDIFNEYEPTPRDTHPKEKNDTVMLLYSSGTTGNPKGVMLTHENITIQTLQMLDAFDWQVEDRCLVVLPFYHCYGLIAMLLNCLYFGNTVYTLPKFDPVQFLSCIQNFKIQRLPIVPPIAVFLKNHPIVEKFDLSSLQTFIIGAAAIDEIMAEAMNKKFPDTQTLQGFGMTESSPVICLQRNRVNYKNLSSCGIVVADTRIKIVDIKTNENLGPNQKGELCASGPQVMKGYLNNPTATSETVDQDGWLHTGDLAYYDDDLNVYVIDRLKELIKYKGLQVAPSELEDLLLGIPGVVDSCVIGIPDEFAGELPRAYIVTNGDVSEEEIHKTLKEQVSDYKQLRGGIVYVDELPKSPSGKLLRRVLKEDYLKTSSG